MVFMYCNCYRVLTVAEAQQHLNDELQELQKAESADEIKDERSDVMFAINRLVGAMNGVAYKAIVPGDELHIVKMNIRMNSYGCIRSERQACTRTT